MEHNGLYIYQKISNLKYACVACFSEHYMKPQNSDRFQGPQNRSVVHQNLTSLTSFPRYEAVLSSCEIWGKIKPPRPAQEWSYSSHRESIGKALSSPGIRSNKKTHINCGSSARMAGNVCANVDQIRRQGRWNNTTTNGAYLTNLPRELVRSMAGFPA
ncbi:hypothetical protein [Absidia glauca]|uniref:Ndc10 domain-containing protein n=1 Tax=Absidia glauca TaxID=4829 RepID=A0A168QQR9_ABSGL|nr:hypothetical protein [Absidia glauca]